MLALEPFSEGFFLQASLILAVGAQNIFVLNSGLRRQRNLLVAAICSFCDTFLIFVGVLGLAPLFVQHPILKMALGVIGVIFLAFYGLLKLREAKRGIEYASELNVSRSIKQTLAITLSFSLLNPHVYLDTIVLIGSYSAKFPESAQRISFGAGSSAFSIIWFFGLSTAASFASSLLKNSFAMRAISLISGLILLLLSLKLAVDVIHWLNTNLIL